MPPSERDLTLWMAERLRVPFLFPAAEPVPSAFWLASPPDSSPGPGWRRTAWTAGSTPSSSSCPSCRS
ncbi:hypothetical protein GXW82_42915 [Streptacidiphilus sp. 4-A2]|nr:hypothetical protein [Streptacidiphilus sp. 4-A2]